MGWPCCLNGRQSCRLPNCCRFLPADVQERSLRPRPPPKAGKVDQTRERAAEIEPKTAAVWQIIVSEQAFSFKESLSLRNWQISRTDSEPRYTSAEGDHQREALDKKIWRFALVFFPVNPPVLQAKESLRYLGASINLNTLESLSLGRPIKQGKITEAQSKRATRRQMGWQKADCF